MLATVVATTAACWYVGIVATNSDYAFTVTNVFIHGIPYLVLVYIYARGAAREPERARGAAAVMLGRGRGVVVFLATLWAIAYVEELLWDRAVWHDREWLFGDGFDADGLTVLIVPLLAMPCPCPVSGRHSDARPIFWPRSGHSGHSGELFRAVAHGTRDTTNPAHAFIAHFRYFVLGPARAAGAPSLRASMRRPSPVRRSLGWSPHGLRSNAVLRTASSPSSYASGDTCQRAASPRKKVVVRGADSVALQLSARAAVSRWHSTSRPTTSTHDG